MAPVCSQCKQAISSLHPGKPIDHEWQHIPPCPRTGPLQRVAQLWRAVTARLDGRRRRLLVTTQPERCCCGHLYAERGGVSSLYCPKGERLLCQECAAPEEEGSCPAHQVPCNW